MHSSVSKFESLSSFVNWIVLHINLRISFMPLYYPLLRSRTSDSSSAGLSLPNSSKIAVYCPRGIISHRFMSQISLWSGRLSTFASVYMDYQYKPRCT
ncbi:hypothetical protein AVEN_165684-1 [Araneus ventricosus]|uniref:Uncharacterized protein n=1 Tax=Araneus ventricosus TaxID=182803 RepID=A0A4Y2C500_ARAVE|nr:hypothetical protein AVEN_165684-1 [Araneus ventricosus]